MTSYTHTLHRLSRFAGLSLSMLALGFSANASAASTAYIELLQQVEQQQPEKITVAGIQAVQAANQSLSKSWIAGDITLKLHHETDRFTGSQETQVWAAGAEFPVWLPSHKEALAGLSSSYQQQFTAQSSYLTWLASGKLRQLAWDYKKATIKVIAAQKAVEQSLALQDKVQKKVKFGESARLDLLLSQKTVLKQQALLAQAQGALNVIQNQYHQWTQSSILPDSIEEVQLQAVALENHPQLLWLQSNTDISQAKLQQEKAFKTASPVIYVGAQHDKNLVIDNTSLVFSVSIPLGLKSSNRVQIAEQQQAVLAQKVQLTTALFELKQGVITAQQRIDLQQQNLHFAKQQNDLDQKALALAEQAYQLGASTIQDLLLIQQQAMESHLNLELAHADLGQSIAQYNQIMGYSLTNNVPQKFNPISASAGAR
ncbi:TolC family protein [Thiomicrorhabdus arctica]|uniref:TolC family protein n=1 Tax=Thiomicrorhabdus arctica TaxID=131540 RepID=UPI0012FDF6F1|nr:TolC family protein [Thiomicrorhabdus arctica]